MPVSVMKMVLSNSEFSGWIKYIRQKPADITEVQLATIASLVSTAAGGKAKIEDFILSNKNSKKKKTNTDIDAVASLFRGLT